MAKSPLGTVYLLKRAEVAVRSRVEVAMTKFDLTPAQFFALIRLKDASELSAAALAREIGVRPQSMLEIISPLERRGLLQREPSPEHQRTLHMRLTASGRKVLAQAIKVAAKLEAELLSPLSTRQLAVFQECLVTLRDKAGSISAGAQLP